ncbi:hypothetical protein AB0L75_27320 [Streptomyces sp. NPDC052101]|uniref:hypothetical protein n=1 Tax=Streptomyces sp. NPDC052101 TaxID=3155763 RepID=UPI00342D2261
MPAAPRDPEAEPRPEPEASSPDAETPTEAVSPLGAVVPGSVRPPRAAWRARAMEAVRSRAERSAGVAGAACAEDSAGDGCSWDAGPSPVRPAPAGRVRPPCSAFCARSARPARSP